jgi:D-alanyl-lipoteichoic acid acyltransferase DltB (MBOAT superfamily)
MDAHFLLQFLAPVLIGIFYQAYRALSGPGRIESIIFLLAQMALLYANGFVTLPGLALVLALLGAYGILAQTGAGPRAAMASAAFVAFLAYWFTEKYLAVLAGHWTWLKPAASHATPLAVVGISYIGFKFIHFFVDRRSGWIGAFSGWEFVSWLLFFPSVVAGPMQRFQDWKEDRAKTVLRFRDVVEGLESILLGFFMKMVLADGIRGLSLAVLGDGPASVATRLQFIEVTLVYPLYLYFDFAGYSHIAIGIGRFWGIRLPKNFNHPFIARNLAEFWNRWHISLSTLLRDYLYYPLSLVVKRRQFFQERPYIGAAIPPLITFAAVGLWHGLGFGFLTYGLIQGVGLATLAILRQRTRGSAATLWWEKSKIGAVGGAILNYGYVAFSFVFFALPDHTLLVIYHRIVHAVPPITG